MTHSLFSIRRNKFALLFVLFFAPLALADNCPAGNPCPDLNRQIQGSRMPYFGTDSGAANAYAITTIAAIGSGGVLQAGSRFYFIATHANTGASTLAVNGGSAIAIKKNVSTALALGDIALNGLVEVVYDGTNFQLISSAGTSFGGSVTFNGQTVSLGGSGNVNSGASAHSAAINQGNGNAITGVGPNSTSGLPLISQGSSSDPAFGGCLLSNGVNAQTSGYTLVLGDVGKLVTFNGSSLTATLPSSPPASTWCARIQNLNSTALTVSRNGLTINGGTSNITLAQYQTITCVTDNSNYFCTRPLASGSGTSLTESANQEVVSATAPGTCNGSSSAVSAFDAQEQASSSGSTGTQATFAQAVTCGDWMFFAQHSESGTTDPPVVTDSAGACGNAAGHFTLLGKNSGSSNKLWLFACKATTSAAAGDTVSSTVNCSSCGTAIWQMSGLRDFDNSTNTYTSGSTPSLTINPSQTSEVIISAMAMFHNVAVSTPTAPLTQIISQGAFDAMNTAWEQVASVSTVTTAWTCCGAFSGTDNIPMVDAAFFVGNFPSSQTVYYQTIQEAGTDKPQELKLNFDADITTSDDSANHATTAHLNNSGATAGAYGDATHSAVVTVDAKGRVTNISQVPITGSGTTSGLALLEQHTASSSAELDFTTCISSTYDQYEIKAVNLVPATNGANIRIQVSTNGGTSYDSGANYTWLAFFAYSGGSGTTTDVTSALTWASAISSTASNGGASGTILLTNPGSTTAIKQTEQEVTFFANNTGTLVHYSALGSYNVTGSAVNAFKVFASSGNIASGTVRCYGLVK